MVTGAHSWHYSIAPRKFQVQRGLVKPIVLQNVTQATRVQATQSLHSKSSAIASGTVKVSELHTLYYETFGNPKGQAAVFLHGGPGAGCSAKHAQFFDHKHYYIVLFDQRGCGKSTPRGCLEENTTWHLVEDLEKLRTHLDVRRWLVLGGSWGATLALAYAEAFPDAVSALVLRGVCLFREEDIDWVYKQGASYLFPFSWSKFTNELDPAERMDVLDSYHKRLTSSDPSSQYSAALAWLTWEMTLSFFSTSQFIRWDGKQYSVSPWGQSTSETSETETSPEKPVKSRTQFSWSSDDKMPSQVVQARLECHFSVNRGFLEHNQLVNGIDRIRHIPCTIIHGRFDFVCPLANAFALHKAWPEAKLRIVANAGHSMYDSGISRELIAATDLFRLNTS